MWESFVTLQLSGKVHGNCCFALKCQENERKRICVTLWLIQENGLRLRENSVETKNCESWIGIMFAAYTTLPLPVRKILWYTRVMGFLWFMDRDSDQFYVCIHMYVHVYIYTHTCIHVRVCTHKEESQKAGWWETWMANYKIKTWQLYQF